MASNYASALSPYENKGICGLPEVWDDEATLKVKVEQLASWIRESRCLVVHTGAGISTAAGIADFRGPRGVWTLEKAGMSVPAGIAFDKAQPTLTHHALRKLEACGILKKYYRPTVVGTVGLRETGRDCEGTAKQRPCRGRLADVTLDWEDALPESDLNNARAFARRADLSLCLGTTLQITPAGDLPFLSRRSNRQARVVTVNLQPTKHEKKVDLAIHARVDEVMRMVLERLDIVAEQDAIVENPVQLSQHPLETGEQGTKEPRKRTTQSPPRRSNNKMKKEEQEEAVDDQQDGQVVDSTIKRQIKMDVTFEECSATADDSVSPAGEIVPDSRSRENPETISASVKTSLE